MRASEVYLQPQDPGAPPRRPDGRDRHDRPADAPTRSRRAISKRFWKPSRTLAALTAFASRAGAAHSRCCGPACGDSNDRDGASHMVANPSPSRRGPSHMWRLSVAVCALAAITLSQTAGALNASPRMSTTRDKSLNEIASYEDQFETPIAFPLGTMIPYAVDAAQTFCEAAVTVAGIKERGAGLWEIVFGIFTDTSGSSGRFNFRVEIKEAGGQVQRLTKLGQWSFTRRRGFTVSYRIATQRDETINDVEVVQSSTRCMAI